jgi:nitrite reductase (NADH) large subunit
MNVVIIGNSAAGLNALETFREYDKTSSVTIVTKEKGPAYSRVLLPYYLRKKVDYEQLYIRDWKYYQKMNAVVIEDTVTQVDAGKKTLTLKNGSPLSYDRLLIASGSKPVNPPIEGLEGPGIYNMWTLQDTENIERYFQEGKRVLVIGASFVSLQATWAAVKRKLDVSVFVRSRIMRTVLDEEGASRVESNMLKHGVSFIRGSNLEQIHRNSDGSMKIDFSDQASLDFDLIIVGAGIKANIDFLEASDLHTEAGILVNNQMETNIPGIYAAGDAAAGPSVFGEEHVVHGLWPTAVEQGKIAGANMAGTKSVYDGSLNMNVTSMFDLTVASMGKFLENEGDEQIVFNNDSENYFKLVLDKEALIGGTAVGSPDLINSLGLMKTLIQKNETVDHFALANVVEHQLTPTMLNSNKHICDKTN